MISENDQKRVSVLKRLQEEMTTAKITNKYIEKGEEGSPFDILVCNHNGIVGQYFFPEYDAAENVFYFSCMMTIKENISEDEAKALSDKLWEANIMMVCGMMAVYPEIGLVYKLTVPISETLEEDELFETIDITAAHAIALSTSFAGEVLG